MNNTITTQLTDTEKTLAGAFRGLKGVLDVRVTRTVASPHTPTFWVVMADDDVATYKNYCADPGTVTYIDGAGAVITAYGSVTDHRIERERPATQKDVFWSMLGFADWEIFYEQFSYGKSYDQTDGLYDYLADDEFRMVIVPSDWTPSTEHELIDSFS